MLEKMGIPVSGSWAKLDEKTLETEVPGVFLVGDAQTGPDSIVGAMGSARKSVNHILAQEGVLLTPVIAEKLDSEERADLLNRKSKMTPSAENPDEFAAWAQNEASRCLQCDVVCNKCVDVCPNRANVIINTPGGFSQESQILHVDAYCNECGNCAQFCPWDGRPYKDKITVFNRLSDFEDSDNNGFILKGSEITLRQSGTIFKLNWDGSDLSGTIPGGADGQKTAAILKTILTDYSWYCGPVED